MNRPQLIFVFFGIFNVVLSKAVAKDFFSPSGQALVSVEKAAMLGSDWNQDGFKKHSVIVLRDFKRVSLWSGVSYQDETGFQPEVIWLKSSKAALFLHRPQRGEIVVGVFRPDSIEKYESLREKFDIKTWGEGLNNNKSDFKKLWLENWREVEGGDFEGTLVIATTITRRISLRITPGENKSTVLVIDEPSE